MARSGMFNEAQMEQMAKEYKAVRSLKKVATSFNVSVPTIAKYLRSAGVEIGKRGRPKKVVIETATAALLERETAESVAVEALDNEGGLQVSPTYRTILGT